MEETLVQPNLLALTEKNMNAYFETHDPKYVAEDAVFIDLSTGETTKGRDAIGQLLHHVYHVAFDAHAEVHHKMISTEQAMVEGLFVGKHTGEIAGIPATQRTVSVPICVTYSLKDGLIKEARIYLMVNILMEQITSQ